MKSTLHLNLDTQKTDVNRSKGSKLAPVTPDSSPNVDNSDANSVRNSLYSSADNMNPIVKAAENEVNLEEKGKKNSFSRKKNWLKFRKSASMIEQENISSPTTPTSTFYVTPTINIDVTTNSDTNG